MFRIEKIGESTLYIKALGTFPPSIAEDFIKKFTTITSDMKEFSVIVDLLDAILLHVESFGDVLDLLKENNTKLTKSAYVISKNPLLGKEFEILIKKASSPHRKIVHSLKAAKEWVGIDKIWIKRD